MVRIDDLIPACRSGRAGRVHAGLSLVEVLGVLAIVAIMSALLLPTLRVARLRSRLLAGNANMREHVAVFSMYAADYDDQYPFLADPNATMTILRGGGVSIEVRFFDIVHRWPIGMVDGYYDGNFRADVFRSPLMYNVRDPARVDVLPYRYASCFMSRPGFWNVMSRTGPEQWRPVRGSEVRFPSEKGLFLDVSSWYVPEEVALMSEIRYPVGFTDAHVENIAEVNLTTPYPSGEGDWPGSAYHGGVPVLHTIDGAHGRDRRSAR